MPLSTQAPFFSERGMISFSIFYFQFLIFESAVALRRIANRKSQIKNRQSLDSPISHDHFLRPFVPARLVAPRRLAPGRHRITPARGFSFATTVRMIDRVHRHAAHMRAQATPARSPRLAERNVFVLDVADL